MATMSCVYASMKPHTVGTANDVTKASRVILWQMQGIGHCGIAQNSTYSFTWVHQLYCKPCMHSLLLLYSYYV